MTFEVLTPLFVVVLLQSGLIVALLIQRSRRRGVERALHEGQQRYALATTAGAVGVWDWNLATNELYIDTRLKAILGFDDEEISTRPDDWGSRVHPQDVAAATGLVQACIDGTSDVYEIEHRMLHKDGRVKWMLSRGSAMRGADGALQRLVGTKVDITERKLAEEAVRENEAVLQATNREIQNLAGRLIASQEAERARIARDLHDDLSQELAGLSITLTNLKRRTASLPDATDIHSDIAVLQQRTMALSESIRRLSHDLHPSVLDHAGLEAALAAHCAELERQRAINVSFSRRGDVAGVDRDAALCLYRVAQEALRNVVTHAGARHAQVTLTGTDQGIELTIHDDGKGFDVARTRANGRGLGLVSMNERVRLLGGAVSLLTELNRGTTVRVQLAAGRHRSPVGETPTSRQLFLA
jgi:PAS domain S-box-containing protein